MKTFEEIDPHLQIINDIDQHKDSGALDRRRAISGLVYRLADELIAGHPAPRSDDPGYFTRIDGLVPALANELVRQHDMAIAHRTHLAERLEADGGENGAKAAAILREMNAVADSKAALLRARGDSYQPSGETSDEVALPKRQVTAFEAALRKRGNEIRVARAARQAEEAAELRGFYEGRNQAWRLLMENQKRHPDTIKVSRAFLGDFQRDLLHMQKES
ncbi:hypothetical protein [Ruixingdingia sedimenti]|uniref:Uncharacterized protein n=1 Tax=Ruixingdingia sedimenti TaxID=3073604 RepID=A0ABU1FCC3_9RHOB|nr:hypothetical protein [Xinfangfangia sp. LG-4]MDR5654491.1 hypothetical protein [Xinfangfangia sp. LG-4]